MKLRAVLLALLALPVAAAGHAQARITWEPDERIVIGDFSTVVGVAADAWRVYAATAAGLIAWDPARERWDPPLTIEDGYPVAERPSALAWIASEQQLVLGTRAGTLWRIDPQGRRTEQFAVIGEEVQRIVGGEFGTLYVRTPRQWLALESGSFLRTLAGEPSAARAVTEPRLEAMRASLGIDARGQRHALTSWTAGARPDEFFVGTAGMGLLRVDARTLTAQPMPFGVATRGVGAVARIGGHVWFGGDGTARDRANIARADTALLRWDWPGSSQHDTPRGFVSAIAGWRDTVWFGASDGLFAHDPARNGWRRYDTGDALPADRVTALLVHDSTLWVGTRRGACLWQGTACGPTLLPGMPVTALAWCHAALWVGTEAGLFRIADNAQRVTQGRLASNRIQGLACVAGDTLYAATTQDLWANRAGTWVGPVNIAPRTTVRTLAAADGVLWVGGDAAIARWEATLGQWRYYIAPTDVPIGPVWGLLPDVSHLWLATAGGALRLDLQAR